MQTFFVISNQPYLLEAVNKEEAEKAVGNFSTVIDINNMQTAKIIDGKLQFVVYEDKK